MCSMPATQLYTPSEPSIPATYTDSVTIPAPLQKDPPKKGSIMQKILGIGVPIMMGVMMIVMFRVMGSNGGARRVMMMMMGMMMLMTLVQTISQAFGGGGEADTLNTDRQNYFLTLEKSRDKAHEIGRSQHNVQRWLYPNPKSLVTLINSRHRTMWAARPAEDESDMTFEHDDLLASKNSDQSADTWMKARVGTGAIALSPHLEVDNPDSVAPEMLEPVTYQAYANFMTAQSLVPLAPLPVSMDRPAVSMRGDKTRRRDFVRSMVVSMAYNHSPAMVMMGIVTDKEHASEWEWMKWLPHTANRFEPADNYGFPMLRWSNFEEAHRYIASHYNVISALRGRLLIVVDTPNAALRPPLNYETIPGVTFLIVDSADDSRMTHIEDRLHLSDEGKFSAYDMLDIADADFVSVDEADSIARAMAGIQPPGFVHIEVENAEDAGQAAVVSTAKAPELLDVIGTRDLETYDLVGNWHETDEQKTFKVPIGFQVARDRSGNYSPTGELAYLDILQKASGGTGPHGLFQGGTGTGKSFLIVMVILMLCIKYSPRRLMLISADFKGGATFNPLQHLPHFIVNLTNLEGSLDMVDRTQAMLEGEHQRRQQVFAKYDVVDIHEYRKLQKKNKEIGVDEEMEDIPDILFVADEFRAFITNNPQYKDMFGMIAAEGRSTGIHLLIGSQSINPQMLGDALPNFDYGMSLKVKDSSDSNTVIRSPKATQLPPSQIALLFYQDLQDELHMYFKGFNWSVPYRREIRADNSNPHAIEVDQGDTEENSQDTGTQIRVFDADTAAVIPDSKDEPEENVEDDTEVVYEDTDKDVLTALVDMVMEKSQGYTQTRTYWMDPLTIPKSLGEIDPRELMAPELDRGISVRIGDIDTPRRHCRVPMEVKFSDSSSGNLAIVGSAGTGRSMVIKSMVASSAIRYYGATVSWFLYDYTGSALAPLADYPNVSIYGTKNSRDTWRRIKGEVERVLNIRIAAFEEYGFASPDAYFAGRDEAGVVGDDFGWIMVAIDGFGDMATALKESIDDQAEMIDLMKTAARYGIFFVATLNSMNSLGVRYDEVFSQGVRLYIPDHMNTFGASAARQTNMRDIMAQVPQSEPGRVADGSITNDMGMPIFHHGRIILPVADKPEPVAVKESGPIYNQKKDYSDEIVSYGKAIAQSPAGEYPADKLQMVGTMPIGELYASLDMDALRNQPQAHRVLPYGVDVATYLPALAAPAGQIPMNHVFIAGAAGSGRTTTLRTFMRSAAQMHGSKQAKFIMLDNTGSLINDFKYYRDQGFIKPANYIMSKDKLGDVQEFLTKIIAKRAPKEDQLMENPEMLRDRTYFTGPEIYIFIDNAESFLSNGFNQGALEKIMKSLPSYDVGIHIIMTLPAGNLPTIVSSNKGVLDMVDNHDPMFLLHSGPTSAGAVIMGTKTRFMDLPAGRVQLFNRQHFNTKDVPQVQIAFTPEGGSDN